MLLPTKHAKTTLLNLPKIDQPNFGPNATELSNALTALASSDNYEVLAVLESYSLGGINREALDHKDYRHTCDKLDVALKEAGRLHNVVILTNNLHNVVILTNKVNTNIGTYPHLIAAIKALAARDLVGRVISQQEYDQITKPLHEFLEIATQTPPNSDLRSLVMNLYITGSPAKVAISTAKAALLT